MSSLKELLSLRNRKIKELEYLNNRTIERNLAYNKALRKYPGLTREVFNSGEEFWKSEYNYNEDENNNQGNNNQGNMNFGRNTENTFYKVLSKKVQGLNNNSKNRWKLHLASPNGKTSWGGTTRKIADFLSLKRPVEQIIRDKPNGLWTSGLYKSKCTIINDSEPNEDDINVAKPSSASRYVNNTSWVNWLKSQSNFSEEPNPSYNPTGRLEFFIVKSHKSQILQITTLKQFDAFERKYGLPPDRWKMVYIDWPRVASEYSGINITPFQPLRAGKRGHWYSGWDCSSEVIWNPEAVKEIRKLNLSTVNFRTVHSDNVNNINVSNIQFETVYKNSK